jgi:diaminohydroxyphosphoribosylaminopyrimidine deaminase/5-amino-6-(5-phosphoribosylamino)uracil reductase
MSVLVEGGSQVNTSFLFSELVDKVFYFVAPKIIGGKEAPQVVGGEGVSKVVDGILIKDKKVSIFGDDILISGYPEYRE